MDRIDANRHAWSRLSGKHYEAYKKRLLSGEHALNGVITRELGALAGKRVIHLQCNTGADTLLLARTAKHVTGVDLVPENVHFAQRLARDLDVTNVDFIVSDVLKLDDIALEPYDVVFTTEGVLGWLPELDTWARVVRGLLRDDGFLYALDSHPFMLCFDEDKLRAGEYAIRYPYFGTEPDEEDSIGGYASAPVYGVKSYFWMHTISEIINSLTRAGMHIAFFNEYPWLYYDFGGMTPSAEVGSFALPFNKDKFPMTFSLKATVYAPAARQGG